MSLEVQEIRGVEELNALEPEWRSLWERDPAATPFHSPDWLLPWTRHLWGGGRIRTLAVRCDGGLAAVAPMFLWGYGAKPEIIRTSFLGSGISDYLGMTALPEHAPATAALLFEYLQSIHGEWDECDLQELRAGCTLLRAPVPRDLKVGQQPCSICPVVPLAGSMEEHLARLDGKFRRNLRTAAKRLQEAGAVQISRPPVGEEGALLERLFDLHAMRWQERGEAGMFAEHRLRAFHREVAARFSQRGMLRLFGLSLNGQVIAVQYNVAHDRRWYYYLSGFDPEWRRASPGAVLVEETIRQAFLEGIREIDFLRQGEGFKYEWGGRDQVNWRLRLTRRGASQREVA